MEGIPLRFTPGLKLVLGLALAATACGGGSGDDATSTAKPPNTAAPSTAAGASPAARAAASPVAGGYAAQRVLPQLAFDEMLGLVPIPGDTQHALLLTKDGTVRRVSMTDDGDAPTVFMDIRSRIIKNPGQEEGLLGVAFAPDYPTSHKFYLYFSAGDPRRQVISRFVSSGEQADPSTEHVLLEIADPFSNHNGGAMAFGPDGYLYLGEGDGGSGGDPMGNGQNTNVLLGKIMRIDVSGDGYTIPPENPFASGGGRGEVYAYGLRNPWRISFDPKTGELWVADVGQGKWEEVDRIEKGGNYGWNIMEGNHCYKPSDGCDMNGLKLPRAEYSHDGGSCSITGGYVYRGKQMPELDGWYVYGDFCSGRVWALNTEDDAREPVQLMDTKDAISSFAQDQDGELYLVTFTKHIEKLARAG